MISPRVLVSLVGSWLIAVALFACGDNAPAKQPPDVTLVSIAITPPAPSFAAGTTQQLVATGMFSDATTRDLSAMVTWSSSAPATATVDAQGLVTGLASGAVTVSATVEGITGSAAVTVTAATLVSLAITPTNPSIAAGTTVQLTATGTFTDHTTQNLSAQVAWSSDAIATATVDTVGLATAVAKGTATITATMGTTTATTTLTATDAVLVSIAVTPTTPTIAAGLTQQFAAVGTYTDNTHQTLTSSVTWASDTAAHATIDGAGLATGVAKGTATISATSGTIVGSTLLTVTDATLVSIEVTPTDPNVPHGLTKQFTATGTFTDTLTHDITSQVTWTSSMTGIATISNASPTIGLATTAAEGDTTITATSGTITGTTTLHVTPAALVSIDVTPATPQVPLGLHPQLTAIGTYTDASTQPLTDSVLWESSDPTVATISNAALSHGLATTLAEGPTTITATSGTIVGTTVMTVTPVALVSIQVTPVNPSIAKGTTLPFVAVGTYSDTTTTTITTAVTWSTSNGNATISNASMSEGVAKGTGVGTSTITATKGTVSGSTTLTVNPADLVSIQITPVTPRVAAGFHQSFTATGTYTDTSTGDITADVTWASTDPSVATISNVAGTHGVATTLIAGPTTISATLGTVSTSTLLTVTSATLVSIQVTPASTTLAKGLTLQYAATGFFSDASTSDLTTQVTWGSTDASVAPISNATGSQGLANGTKAGTTTISATLSSVIGSTDLTVTPAVITAIDVTPADASLVAGLTVHYSAMATYSDATSNDVTTQVAWSSSKIAFAQISNAMGSEGLATGIAAGDTTIAAALNGVTGSTTLTVTAATLVSIDVTPKAQSLAKGRTLQYVAKGTYTDASIVDLTTQVTWGSSDGTIAQISSASGSEGLAKGLAANATPVTITATLGAVSGSTTLTVTAAVLESIAITPSPVSVAPGASIKLVATGTFSDLTTSDLSTTATWTSLDPATATVVNGASGGRVTGVAVGATTVKAASGTIFGTVPVTVPTVAVTATMPADGARGVKLATPIVVQFNQAVTSTTVTAQMTAGACTGTVQVSSDDFATCLAMTTVAPTMTTTAIAMYQPAAALSVLATYKIKVVVSQITNAAGVIGGADYTQASGWQTASDGTCPTALVISQVYGAGGNAGATYLNDFVELHNSGITPISLAGLSLQYASATGPTGTSQWSVVALPSVSVAAGGYYLVALASSGANGVALPATADFSSTTINMSGTSGKIALVDGTTPLPAPTSAANCTNWLALAIDFVGYGKTADCTEGGVKMTSDTSPTAGAVRAGAGCTDANANTTDFTVVAQAPRNSATTALTCACTANETDKVAEIDYCNLQFPTTPQTATVGTPTATIYGRVYEAGFTEAAGANSSITMQVGYGASGDDPAASTSTFQWFPAAFNVQVGNNDEYGATFTAPAAGTYAFTTRATRDGTNWTYCDLDGAGANTGLTFDKTMLGSLTTTP